MPILPPALAAFSVGAVLLQWQPALPGAAAWLAGAGVAALVAVFVRLRVHAGPAATAAIAFVAICGAGALGFGYAALRAESRLGDALPAEWEGVDVAVVGVVDELPRPSEQGTRFAFAVERVETRDAVVPSRISLAWYASRRGDGAAAALPRSRRGSAGGSSCGSGARTAP